MDVSSVRISNIKSSIDGLVQRAFDSAKSIPLVGKIIDKYDGGFVHQTVSDNYVLNDACLHSNNGPYEGAGAEFSAGEPPLNQCYDCGAMYLGYD
jgi:hypothetical protein